MLVVYKNPSANRHGTTELLNPIVYRWLAAPAVLVAPLHTTATATAVAVAGVMRSTSNRPPQKIRQYTQVSWLERPPNHSWVPEEVYGRLVY